MKSQSFQEQYGVNFHDNAKRTATFAIVPAGESGLVANMTKVHTFAVTGKQARLAAKGEKMFQEWCQTQGYAAENYKCLLFSM
jgi:hypothetical protein